MCPFAELFSVFLFGFSRFWRCETVPGAGPAHSRFGYGRVGDILVPGVGIRNIKIDIREGVDYCIGNIRFITHRGILSF